MKEFQSRFFKLQMDILAFKFQISDQGRRSTSEATKQGEVGKANKSFKRNEFFTKGNSKELNLVEFFLKKSFATLN